MENRVSLADQFRNPKDYSEFEFFDGEEFVKFNIIEVNEDRKLITVAVTDRGRISVYTYELMNDGEHIYFEHGPLYTQVDIEEVES